MEILIKKDCYISGHHHKKGDVVEVSSAEARQWISSGHAEELDYKSEKPKTKAVKKTKTRKD